MLDNINLFKLASQKMGYNAERQKVISENIANVDTPEYKGKDLKAFTSNIGGNKNFSQLVKTDDQHMDINNHSGNYSKEDLDNSVKLNGNNVNLEEEIIKMSEVQADYQLVTNLYGKTKAMFNTAIGKNR